MPNWEPPEVTQTETWEPPEVAKTSQAWEPSEIMSQPTPGFAFFNSKGEPWTPEHGEEDKFEFPTQEHFFSKEYEKQKEESKPGIAKQVGEIGSTLGKGAVKAIQTSAGALTKPLEGDFKGALSDLARGAGSMAEAAAQGAEMGVDIGKTAADLLGNQYAKGITGLLGTRKNLDQVLQKEEYEKAKEHTIRQTRRWEKGQSILGDLVRDVDKDFAKFVDSNVDQEMALTLGLAGAVPIGGIKAIGNAYKLYKAGNLAKAAEEVASASKAFKGTAKGTEEVATVAKPPLLQAPPIITQGAKMQRDITTGIEKAKGFLAKPLSVAGGVLDQPLSTALQVGGAGLRKTGELAGKGIEWAVQHPKTLAAAAGGVTLANEGDLKDALIAAGSTYVGGNWLAKAKAMQNLSSRMGTIGDLVASVGKASKLGGGKAGLLGAARTAKTETVRQGFASAAGLTPADTMTKTGALAGFAAKEGLSALKHLGDPIARGMIEGAVIIPATTGNLDDIDSGIAFGVPLGLSSHGFGYLTRYMGNVPKNAESALRYTREWLNEKTPAERKLLSRQSPLGLHLIADLESMAKGFGGEDAKVIYHTPETFANLVKSMGESAMAAESPGVFIQPRTATEPPTVHVQADMALASLPHEVLGHLFAHLDAMAGVDNKVLTDSKQRFRDILMGVDTVDADGNPVQRPPLYSPQALRRIAERYYTPLGKSPETMVVNGEEVLTPEETLKILQEIESETGRFFAHDVLRSSSDIVARALAITKMSDAELEKSIKETSSRFGQSPLLGVDFKLTPEVLRRMAQKTLDTLSVTRPKGFHADVGFPEGGVVVQPATWQNMASQKTAAVETAKTPEEVLKATRERDELVDSEVYGTRRKTNSEIYKEAAILAQAKLERPPTETEIRQEMTNVNPRALVNDRGGAFKPGDMPMLLTKREQEAVTEKYNVQIREAIRAAGPQEDPNAVHIFTNEKGEEMFRGRYFTPEQVPYLRAIDPRAVPKHHIENIILLNSEMQKGTGRSFNYMYHKAIAKRGNVPRQRYVASPFGWYGSKADNVSARVLDVTALERDIARESAKKSSEYLDPFREFGEKDLTKAADRFREKFFQYLDNHLKGLPGETGLHPDAKRAVRMKDALNGFLGINKGVNPLSRDSSKIKSNRVDRMFNAQVSAADPTPIDYGKVKMNFMPKVKEFDKKYRAQFYVNQPTGRGTKEWVKNLGKPIIFNSKDEALKHLEKLRQDLQREQKKAPPNEQLSSWRSYGRKEEQVLRAKRAAIHPDYASYNEWPKWQIHLDSYHSGQIEVPRKLSAAEKEQLKLERFAKIKKEQEFLDKTRRAETERIKRAKVFVPAENTTLETTVHQYLNDYTPSSKDELAYLESGPNEEAARDLDYNEHGEPNRRELPGGLSTKRKSGEAWLLPNGKFINLADYGENTHNHMTALSYGDNPMDLARVELLQGHVYAPVFNAGGARVILEGKKIIVSTPNELRGPQQKILKRIEEETPYKVELVKEDSMSDQFPAEHEDIADEVLEHLGYEATPENTKTMLEYLDARRKKARNFVEKSPSKIQAVRNFAYMPKSNELREKLKAYDEKTKILSAKYGDYFNWPELVQQEMSKLNAELGVLFRASRERNPNLERAQIVEMLRRLENEHGLSAADFGAADKAWLTPNGKFISVEHHDNAFGNDAHDASTALPYKWLRIVVDGDTLYWENPEVTYLTTRQREALNDVAAEHGLRVMRDTGRGAYMPSYDISMNGKTERISAKSEDEALRKFKEKTGFTDRDLKYGQPKIVQVKNPQNWNIQDNDSGHKIAEYSDLTQDEAVAKAEGEFGERDYALRSFMPLAPSNERFYSTLQRTLEDKMPERASTEQVLNILRGGAVKADELHWTGIEDFLKGKEKVTKQEVLDYLDEEGKIRIEETTLTSDKPTDNARQRYQQELNRLNDQYGDSSRWPEADQERMQMWDADLMEQNDLGIVGQENTAKFSNYSLPGGENYRELVMSLPETSGRFEPKQENDGSFGVWDNFNKEFAAGSSGLKDNFIEKIDAQKRAAELNKEYGSSTSVDVRAISDKYGSYRSSHFPDVPNYLAHLRMDDRVDSDGKPGLFIEELQSDRHQAGREKGYSDEGQNLFTVKKSLTKEGFDILDKDGNIVDYGRTESLAQAIANQKGKVEGKISPAPFSKTWYEFLLKRALAEAVETGKDWLGWTTGETQAERYDLSKQIDSLEVYRGKDVIDVTAKKNGEKVLQEQVTPEKLPDMVGKTLAEKILNLEPNISNEYSGDDLKVGGFGMREFYDKMLPRFAEKYVRKWGGKVEQGEIATGKKGWIVLDEHNKLVLGPTNYTRAESYYVNRLGKNGSLQEAVVENYPIWKLPITDAMRTEIGQKGQAMFMPSSKLLRKLSRSEYQTSPQSEESLKQSRKMGIVISDLAMKSHDLPVITSEDIKKSRRSETLPEYFIYEGLLFRGQSYAFKNSIFEKKPVLQGLSYTTAKHMARPFQYKGQTKVSFVEVPVRIVVKNLKISKSKWTPDVFNKKNKDLIAQHADALLADASEDLHDAFYAVAGKDMPKTFPTYVEIKPLRDLGYASLTPEELTEINTKYIEGKKEYYTNNFRFMSSSKTILPSLNLPAIVDSPTFPIKPPTNEQEETSFKNLTLALTLLGEARGEQKHGGMNAVAQVILNRARKNNTEPIQEALKPKQFSFWNNPISGKESRKLLQTPEGETAMLLATAINEGRDVDERVSDSLNYYNPKTASPEWGKKFDSQKIPFTMIGNHKFYHNAPKSSNLAQK